MSAKNRRRIQRRFDKQLDKQVSEHQRKLDNGKLSLPSHLGKLVITVSNASNTASKLTPEEQNNAFMKEAERIAEKRTGLYAAVVLRSKTVAQEFAMDIRDPEVSDMVLIGHGNIGDFWTDKGGHFGAFDAASNATYLKQGKIEQRICGHFPFVSSVPLGTFALSDQRNLIAPLGKTIDDIEPDESLFIPVYGQAQNSADDIRALIKTYHGKDA